MLINTDYSYISFNKAEQCYNLCSFIIAHAREAVNTCVKEKFALRIERDYLELSILIH
jgi:hypothetical protein